MALLSSCNVYQFTQVGQVKFTKSGVGGSGVVRSERRNQCWEFASLHGKVISKCNWVKKFHSDVRWPTQGSENTKRPHVATCVTQCDFCVYS